MCSSDLSGKKVEAVVAQGSVRLNMIIKRKNETLKKIFRKWFLLYKENMPPNKFMRIAGNDKDNPWEFQNVTYQDFDLKSIPDFELTGNILNVNKTLEVSKRLAVYNVLIGNPLFSPQTAQGLQAIHSLTKWLVDGLDDNTGLSRIVPQAAGDNVQTPEEENARFMQGDTGTPTEGEDHVYHIKIHNMPMMDPNVPDSVKQNIAAHIADTIQMYKNSITQQMVMMQSGMMGPQGMQPGMSGMPQGGMNGISQGNTGNGQAAPSPLEGVLQREPAGMV